MIIGIGWIMTGIYFLLNKLTSTYSVWPGNVVLIMTILTLINYPFSPALLIGALVVSLPLIIGFLMVGVKRIKTQGLTAFNLFFVTVASVGTIFPLVYWTALMFNKYGLIFNWLMKLYQFVVLYIVLDYLHLLSTYFYYQFKSWQEKVTADPMVVLGCGLFNRTELSPTLKLRVQGAIHYHQKDQLITMSGGQGSDEDLPEGVAMKHYALAHGIPTDQIQVEDASTTTYENLKNTKELLSLDDKTPLYIVSSNYHLPRALYYARQLKLNGVGLYAKSPKKLWCLMLFREWVAFVVLRRRWHMILFPIFLIMYYYFL
ncbi:hypothetical protein CJ205_02025 [Dolosicoccus paucivorans]|uniref:DUF218 domain-containing protein n=1 Tax=Dolosicoccus paucivorans TaxID=84521 RepID=A0A2N6SP49_9LACT|nr:YdcF family protein [Dolosicoccus paucivorans]PMB84852.1 hypothetical protein CJ206_01485 [Dolosicoccus paucivorans]PMC58848.1 hypothetical protein CJ205_02025 [Dolosicoccus paucivorans]